MRKSHLGFTLVEMLVVIAIVGMLMSLLLPAVNAAREAARRTVCNSNLQQMGRAAAAYETEQRCLPPNGWGYAWSGDPDCGGGKRQPGGWTYGLLPHMDQMTLFMMGASGTNDQNAKKTGIGKALTFPVNSYYCPSRRAPQAYTFHEKNCYNGTVNSDVCAKVDYAINAGGKSGTCDGTGPGADCMDKYPSCSFACQHPNDSTGVGRAHYEVTDADIKDGKSNTLLFAEKYLRRESYDGTVRVNNDDGHALQGHDFDTARWVSYIYTDGNGDLQYTQYANRAVSPDRKGNDMTYSFGSSHAIGFNAAYCDGAARLLTYLIDDKVFAMMGNIADMGYLDWGAL